MPPRRQTVQDDKAKTPLRSPRKESQTLDAVAGPLQDVSLIQRARLAPDTLAPGDVVRLQRTMGNHALANLLERAPAASIIRSQAAAEPVQRKKDEQARGEKHRRVAKSREVVDQLSGNIQDDLNKHIYDAKPFGKAIDQNDPQGLHAYKNDALPKDVEVVGTKGSTGKVHEITWKYKNKQKTKASTMFPTWMPPEHVNTLIALKYPEDTKVVKEKVKLVELAIAKEKVIEHISHGQKIELGKSGDTVYPVM